MPAALATGNSGARPVKFAVAVSNPGRIRRSRRMDWRPIVTPRLDMGREDTVGSADAGRIDLASSASGRPPRLRGKDVSPAATAAVYASPP